MVAWPSGNSVFEISDLQVSGSGLEGRFVGVTAGGGGSRSGRGPRVIGRCAAAAGALGAETAAGGAALGAVDLGRGVAQRRADLIDIEFDDGALLTLAGLERALLEPT